MSTERYDVIIVGTGAGGGTLAHHLAPTGKRILLLERGDYLPRERDNWDSKAVMVDGKYKADETWFDKDGRPFHPGIHYCVGGNTKFYGAVLLRLRERDFGTLHHRGGVSPPWPISYADLAPYYLRAERLYSVHGQRGSDPTEPPCADPYPYPPVSHEPRIQELSDDLTRAGHRPFPLPVGIRLDEAQPHRSACVRCPTCDGFPCLVQAKADAHVTCVAPAVEHPNVTLLTGAYAERLETGPSGRAVTGVVVRRNGVEETYRGDLVVVSCGAINSAALLLRSASDQHPGGLANGSGVVGRHYMCHLNSALVAVSRRPNPTRFQKTLGINDFYFGADDWDYPLGHIQMLGKTDAAMFAAESGGLLPGFAADTLATRALDFWLTSEDLPDPDNRVEVGRDGRITLRYTPNNVEAHERLVAKLKGLLGRIGCERTLIPREVYFGKRIAIAGTGHQNGTIRFGHDPKSSALDVNCKAHEVDNLYVVDASVFPSSAAVNPTLTILANALRVGDHLIERLGATVGAA
ncbi:GMC family oxidoreductase [Azospirillum sp. Sh1]|uniref:GMC oxidoreductase n=1 Tax=Azospirillum sp. Sh1 TaxID=2607285 RepID=UPI0011EFDC74|nr:GMC family oxidoreductase [Azospirillum sp. Sh1]KAA0570955.1 GMC family oxidoreductase [Azospirillum sp. Sh1]